MEAAGAARTLNDVGDGDIGSRALPTTGEEPAVDRLPARAEDLADPDPDGGIDGLAAAGVKGVAVHDFSLDSGADAPAWLLPHVGFAPGLRSRTTFQLGEIPATRGWIEITTAPLLDEVTSPVVDRRPETNRDRR